MCILYPFDVQHQGPWQLLETAATPESLKTDNSLELCQITPTFPWLRAAGKTEGLGINT